jgi:hypothetical protein
MRMQGRVAFIALLVACAIAALPAGATPQSDFNAVYADWRADGQVTPCRFSQQELQNAYNVANANPDFSYSPAFSNAVQREISRWKNGGCAGVTPESKRRLSKLFGAQITRVRGRGKASKEYVWVTNRSTKTLSFRKATLRNRSRGKATFPARFKLRKNTTALVYVGCARGKRRASFRGAYVWLCRRKQLFRDKGDVARLADSKGIVVSQRGFGTFKNRVAY